MNTGDPETVLYRAERRVLKIQTKLYQGSGRPTWGLWRARCGESRTAGSGSGPGKRAGRKTGTAPRTDFTTLIARTGRCISSRPQAPLPHRPELQSGRCDEIDSAASYTSICRSRDVTEFSAPTGPARVSQFLAPRWSVGTRR